MIYETVVGLEVHVELATESKLFCACPSAFGCAENENCCEVCLGLPGSLPTVNRKAVEYAIRTGLALQCDISEYLAFDRKNYFYPDLPKAYQISQLYHPLCRNGFLNITGKRIHIHEIHLEEDAGKLIHGDEFTYVDYNRCGIPLIEIVTCADFRSGIEVVDFLRKLRLLLRYLHVSDCKMEEGSMRVDVNLSVRPVGEKALGIRTEMKNLSSFRAVEQAIEAESKRQIALLQTGGRVVQETRRWDEKVGSSYPMRNKEEARDYRYFPEPDIPTMRVDKEWVMHIRSKIPELPEQKKERWQREYNLSNFNADTLLNSEQMACLFDQAALQSAYPKQVANWILMEVMRLQNEGVKPNFSAARFAELVDLAGDGKIGKDAARAILKKLCEEDFIPAAYAAEHGLLLEEDPNLLDRTVKDTLKAFPQAVSDYRNGKEKAVGFLIGQVMKKLYGKANSHQVSELVKKHLQNC